MDALTIINEGGAWDPEPIPMTPDREEPDPDYVPTIDSEDPDVLDLPRYDPTTDRDTTFVVSGPAIGTMVTFFKGRLMSREQARVWV